MILGIVLISIIVLFICDNFFLFFMRLKFILLIIFSFFLIVPFIPLYSNESTKPNTPKLSLDNIFIVNQTITYMNMDNIIIENTNFLFNEQFSKLYFLNCSNIIIKNSDFTRNNIDNTQSLLQFYKCNNISINYCEFNRNCLYKNITNGNGFILLSFSDNYIIERNNFNNGYLGIKLYRSCNGIVRLNTFYNCNNDYFYNAVITVFNGNGKNTTNIEISDNYIEFNKPQYTLDSICIAISGEYNTNYYIDNISILRNKCIILNYSREVENNGNMIYLHGYHHNLNRTVRNVLIKDNYIYTQYNQNVKNGIVITLSMYITVENNTIINTLFNGIYFCDSLFCNCIDNTIINSSIIDNTYSAIYLYNSKYIKIYRNYLSSNGYGVKELPNCDYNIIKFNNITKCLSIPRILTYGIHTIVLDNYIYKYIEVIKENKEKVDLNFDLLDLFLIISEFSKIIFIILISLIGLILLKFLEVVIFIR